MNDEHSSQKNGTFLKKCQVTRNQRAWRKKKGMKPCWVIQPWSKNVYSFLYRSLFPARKSMILLPNEPFTTNQPPTYNPQLTTVLLRNMVETTTPLKISGFLKPKVMKVDGSDEFPFQNGWIFRFQPLIFQGGRFLTFFAAQPLSSNAPVRAELNANWPRAEFDFCWVGYAYGAIQAAFGGNFCCWNIPTEFLLYVNVWFWGA